MILIPRIELGIVIEAGDFFLLSDVKNLDGLVILDSRPLLLLDDDLEVLNAVILELLLTAAELVLAGVVAKEEEKGRNRRSGREVVVEEVVAIKLAVAMYTPLECILIVKYIIYYQ